MSKITIRFASWRDKNDIFTAIKDGRKTIETRPATEKYTSVVPGDILNLISLDTNERLQKKVEFIRSYKSVKEMANKEPAEKIVPGVKSANELISVFEEFKKKWGREYTEKLEKYGIVAIGLK